MNKTEKIVITAALWAAAGVGATIVAIAPFPFWYWMSGGSGWGVVATIATYAGLIAGTCGATQAMEERE